MRHTMPLPARYYAADYDMPFHTRLRHDAAYAIMRLRC